MIIFLFNVFNCFKKYILKNYLYSVSGLIVCIFNVFPSNINSILINSNSKKHFYFKKVFFLNLGS